jgi:hypothetical protein
VTITTAAELEDVLNEGADADAPRAELMRRLRRRLGVADGSLSPRYTVRGPRRGGPEIPNAATFLVAWHDDVYEVVCHHTLAEATDVSRVPVPGTGWGTGAFKRALVVVFALSCARRFSEVAQGGAYFCLADRGDPGMVSFTARSTGPTLIPDPDYLETLGYEKFRNTMANRWIPWSTRRRTAIWRGTLNGTVPTESRDDWAWLPRAQLCSHAEHIFHREVVDARITSVGEYIASEYADKLDGIERFFGEPIEAHALAGYRYLIDIDGWANAWSGLFQKLLTGSTVLKVESHQGYRQWYYDRLEPWVHYVPIKADLSDFDEALEFVLSHDAEAENIGRAGRRLALSLNLEAEIFAMASAVDAHHRKSQGLRAETSISTADT